MYKEKTLRSAKFFAFLSVFIWKGIFNIYAQNSKLDSLVDALEYLKEDTQKVKTYFEIVKIYRRIDLEKGLEYGQKELELSHKLNYQWGLGKAHNQLGLIKKMQLKYDAANTHFKNALLAFDKLKDYVNLTTVYINLSESYVEEEKADSAFKYLAIGKKYNDNIDKNSYDWIDNELNILSDYANIYHMLNMMDSTIFYSLQTVQLASENGYDEMAGISLLQLGAAYQKLKENDKAIQYYFKALAYLKGNTFYEPQILTGIGMSHYSKGNFDSTIIYTKKSIDIEESLGGEFLIPMNFLNLGLAYKGKKKYTEAITAFTKGLELKKLGQDEKRQLQLFLGDTYKEMKDWKKAEKFYLKNLDTKDSLEHRIRYMSLYALSDVYANQNDYKKAFIYLEKAQQHEKLFVSNEHQRSIKELEVKYETHQKEKEIHQLKTENQLREALIQSENQKNKFAYLSLCIILLSGGYLFQRFKKKKLQENKQNLINERLRLSAELHDEVGSTLSGISMYSYLAKSQFEAKNNDLIKSLNEIHQSSGEMVNKLNEIVWLIHPGKDTLSHLLEKTEDYLRKMAAIKNILVKLDSPSDSSQVVISELTRRNIYLILKEGINNAVKYSNCNTIHLSTRKESSKLYFQLSDNGKGMDLNTVVKNNGLINMKKRAMDIGADFILDSEIDSGTKISIDVVY